jgi:lactose/L-arabinose transport system substrate-binding protein
MKSTRMLCVVLGLLLQGCARAKPDAVELTMWLVGSEAQARTINALAKSFTQRTGIAVRCEAISWGEAHSKYLTAVAGEVQPDIGTMGLTWGSEFGRLGALVDLRQAFPEDTQAMHDATFGGLWESIEQDGQVFGVPFDVSLQVLYYRTDLIPQPPQTWEELTSLLQALRTDGRRMVIDWGNLSWIGYAPFLWQAGGAFYTPDGRGASLNTPQAVRALEFFRDLYTRYEVPRTSIPVEQGLRTGEFPLAVSGNWKMITITIGVPEIAGKWSIAPLPRGPSGKRTAFLGGRIMGIFANSTHRSEAWQFLRYLFEPQVQVGLYQGGLETQDAYLPSNRAAWDALPMDQTVRAALRQQADEGKGPPAVSGWTETTHVVESSIQRAVLYDADPKDELAQAHKAMNRAIQQERR